MEESVVNMGIFLGKHNRSSSWIGRFDPKNPQDMKEYEMVKAVVRTCNTPTRKFRVEKKGRKPTNGFVYGGNPRARMKNDKLWHVYVYKRYTICLMTSF